MLQVPVSLTSVPGLINFCSSTDGNYARLARAGCCTWKITADEGEWVSLSLVVFTYLFIFGYLKDASKAPRKGPTFLCFYVLNPRLSDCHIFPAKEKLRESAVGGFVLLQMEEDKLVSAGTIWSQVFIAGIQAL